MTESKQPELTRRQLEAREAIAEQFRLAFWEARIGKVGQTIDIAAMNLHQAGALLNFKDSAGKPLIAVLSADQTLPEFDYGGKLHGELSKEEQLAFDHYIAGWNNALNKAHRLGWRKVEL